MTAIKAFFISVAFIFVHQSALAATTYYIDSAKGSDAWSGNFPDPVGAPAQNGPWQSLAKLAQAPLQPGDTVALRCGRNWTETLKVPASGISGASIKITNYPNGCGESLPTIEGAYPLATNLWSKHSPSILKVNLASLNLLVNSGFEAGLSGWRIWSPGNDAELSAAASCGTDSANCMRFKSGKGPSESLVYSNTFSIIGGIEYKLKFQFKASSGTRVRAIVRSNVSPWNAVGADKVVVGNGAWQQISLPFKATAQIPDARLDFEMAPGGYSTQLDDISIEPQIPSPKAARLGNTPLSPAHHPNRGFNPLEPGSMYLRNATTSNAIPIVGGGRGSTYITSGGDLELPQGATLQAGLGISIRTNAWIIDDRKIASISGSSIILDEPTSYPVVKNWGYFFTGALWMVDEPNEWHFDPTTKTAYIGVSSDNPPRETVYMTMLDTCVDVAGKKYIHIENIRVQGCGTGVRIEGTSRIELQNIWIQHMSGVGVYAAGAASAKLTRMTIERIGAEAIVGAVFSKGIATSMILTDSTIVDSGISRVNGNLVSLPSNTRGAVIAGPNATVARNRIQGVGYHGIRVYENSHIEHNVVEDTCLVLDDCGGIYAGGTTGSQITNNLVRGVHGSVAGKPIGATSQAEGIYLDDHANGITVSHNTVSDAEHGIFLHNAFNNIIQENTVYGNRRGQIWLMEDSRLRDSSGDLYGNQITQNQVFSLVPSAAVLHETSISNTSRFAAYDLNRYSALISPRVVNESWPTGSASFDFKSWQVARTPDNQPRHQDVSGSIVASTGYASYKIVGTNIIENGSFSSGTTGWTPWSETGGTPAMQLYPCGTATCTEFISVDSTSLLASPPFSVTEAAWYRVSFDIQASSTGVGISVLPRRGGGGNNGYESLSSTTAVAADQALKRVSFAFKASKSVSRGNSSTGDVGARLYFTGLLPGQKIYVANLEIVPISPSEDSLQTRLLTNPSDSSLSQDCPDEGSRPELCTSYVDFTTGALVAWPTEIQPRRSLIIYSRDLSKVDTDGDGITDSQDKCADTPAGAAANASGCALEQS